MIVDSSAILAILLGEEDADQYARAIESADECRMSAVNWLETAIRVDLGGNPIASNAFDDFMREADVMVEAVDMEQVRLPLIHQIAARSQVAGAAPNYPVPPVTQHMAT